MLVEKPEIGLIARILAWFHSNSEPAPVPTPAKKPRNNAQRDGQRDGRRGGRNNRRDEEGEGREPRTNREPVVSRARHKLLRVMRIRNRANPRKRESPVANGVNHVQSVRIRPRSFRLLKTKPVFRQMLKLQIKWLLRVAAPEPAAVVVAAVVVIVANGARILPKSTPLKLYSS